ncbi:LysR family transcriptional regulator [Agrobacterium tumefaciens]|uniref:LysR family transcriptional regulator n=1 Tax=Agrobacterium tumefaciens TaxID=358 RepID=UPI0022437E15|nr:LysR family transcriptional regulator [Agrobacterium tumefaciens]MCW8060533.1 LysR family transcriptional regulator [Agrobacterium tumefaciens]MCW8145977.1 LysR family transcriptional regulator [Agrobacterium tumefaciens]
MLLAQSDLRSLTVFRAVVDHKSFLGAQIALGLSQSAISFHIKALEDRLGFKLCQRGRSGFELTDRGAIVHERSKGLFLALNAFESDIGALKNRITGTLRLGLVDNTITDSDLPIHRVIARISERAPEARVELAIDTPDALLSEIANGGLDIALLPETQAYQGLKLSRFRAEIHSLYCAQGHPLFRQAEAELTIEHIETFDFVVRPYANMRELQFFPKARARAIASNMEAQAMFVMSGHYLGYLPDHYARDWVQKGRFRQLMPEETRIHSTFVIATRSTEKPSTILDFFIRELAGIASEAVHMGRSVTLGNATRM